MPAANIAPAYLQDLAATQGANSSTDYFRVQNEIARQKAEREAAEKAAKRSSMWKAIGSGIGFAVNPIFGAKLGGAIAGGVHTGDWNGLSNTIQGYGDTLQSVGGAVAGRVLGGALANKVGGASPAGQAMQQGGGSYLQDPYKQSYGLYDPSEGFGYRR